MNLKALLEKTMELEKMQVSIYEGLEKKFSFSKRISQFWSGMAEDEKGHYEYLMEIYNQLNLGELSVEVSDELYDTVGKGLSKLSPSRLEDVLNLDDAYNLANEVEDYETQPIFKFIHTNFMHVSRLEITQLILEHLDKLVGFSDGFGSANERQLIKVISI